MGSNNQDPVTMPELLDYIAQRFQPLLDAARQDRRRGQLILLTAKIENCLTEIIKAFIGPPRNAKNDELFGRSRPLASFSSKIDLAYRLHILTEEDAKALDTIRDLRNQCAHELDKFSFSSNSVTDRVNNLYNVTLTPIVAVGLNLITQQFDTNDTEERAVVACIIRILMLEVKLLETRQLRKTIFSGVSVDATGEQKVS